MPQAVVHVLFTIIVLDLFRDYIIKNKKKIPLHFIFIGGVAGLLPDVDIPIYWVLKNFLGISVEWFHRTFTHSVFFPLSLLAITLVILIFNKKFAILGGIITFGVAFHIFLDYLLAGKLLLFYPVSNIPYGLELLTNTGLAAVVAGLDAIVLILWLWHEEKKHKISDFI